MKYYIASTVYNTNFVIVEDRFPIEMPPAFVLSGWPPFECDSTDMDILMEEAMKHVTECEYMNLWHIYMN
jgi:hypothetical protein